MHNCSISSSLKTLFLCLVIKDIKRQAYVPKEKVVRALLILDTILPQLVINKLKKFQEMNSVRNCVCFDENRHHFGRKALHILEKTYVGSNQVKSAKRAKD